MNTVYIAFGLFLLVTAYNYIKPQGSRNYTSLNTKEAKEMLDSNKDIILIDVRTRGEYDSGHLRGSKNIPLDQLDNRLSKLPRNKDIMIYCQTGGRSIRAVRKLEFAGITQLYHIHEGMRGWEMAGFSIRKNKYEN